MPPHANGRKVAAGGAPLRQITSEWRAEIEGVTYDLTEYPRPEGAFLEMLAEA